MELLALLEPYVRGGNVVLAQEGVPVFKPHGQVPGQLAQSLGVAGLAQDVCRRGQARPLCGECGETVQQTRIQHVVAQAGGHF